MEKVKDRQLMVTGNSPVISLEKGKVPPQAIDLEKVVLGALMIDGKGVDEVIDLLTPDAFYHKSHQFIFNAIDQLFKGGSPVDLLTVSAQLRRDEKLETVGGDHYLVQLSQLVSSTAHIYPFVALPIPWEPNFSNRCTVYGCILQRLQRSPPDSCGRHLLALQESHPPGLVFSCPCW